METCSKRGGEISDVAKKCGNAMKGSGRMLGPKRVRVMEGCSFVVVSSRGGRGVLDPGPFLGSKD